MKCACGGSVITADDELVCERCGMVSGYAEETPWPSGTRSHRLEYGGMMATLIDSTARDHAGHILRGGTARRLLKHHKWSQDYRRSLPVAMAQLSMLGNALAMPPGCVEYASYIFQKAVASNFLVGRVVRHCTAAAALLACRKHGLSRTLSDVLGATGLSRRDVYRTYRQLYERFDPDLAVPDPVLYITRVAEAANISEATRRHARSILGSMDRTEIAGKDPMGLAAGVLYLSCVRRGEVVLRREIAEAAGIAETTLSNRYNALAGK